MTIALRGLGAVGYNDTGSGITSQNFQDQCCGWFGLAFASDLCNGWANANKGLFGNYPSPCSAGALANLAIEGPRKPLPVGVPNIDLTVPSVENPAGVTDEMIAAQAKANAEQYARFIAQQAAVNNALGADRCGAFTRWNEDKQECEFSLTSPGGTTGVMLGVIAVLLLLSYLKR